jgi:predicted extracellular nuclease
MSARLCAVAAILVMLLANLPAHTALAVSPNIVISQVYGGGGNSGATYTHDFIELFNLGATPVSLNGWSVQYTSATGTGNFGANSGQLTELPDISLAPGQYLLIQEGQGSGGTTPLPAPDVIDSSPIAMSATGGKVALVNSTTPLGCNGGSSPCSPAALATIVDLVGYGSANFFEGSGATPAPSNTTAVLRGGNGCIDTDQNATDFSVAAPLPRNSASPLSPCGEPQPTDPAGSGSATPSLVVAGGQTLLTVAIIPGANPPSTGLSVVVDLASIGGSPAQGFFDDGSNGDVTAGDNIFSYAATVDPSTTPGTKTLPVTITDAESRTGSASILVTIPAPFTPIHAIQGASHQSPLQDLVVPTAGIVTARTGNGFYLQEPVPDGDDATSEAIFVFTNAFPTVEIGDSVAVTGNVAEFRPGGAASGNLTTTELTSPVIRINSSGNVLPAPVIIGEGGRIPPLSVIDNDSTGSVEAGSIFDPVEDGIDFYESLEAMRVAVNNAVAVGPTNAFGEIAVVGDGGALAAVRTTRAGIVIQPGDFNPERIILDDVLMDTPEVATGATFAIIEGVLDYSFGNFKLLVQSLGAETPSTLERETASPAPPYQLAVATFNVENLSSGDPPEKFATLAALIVGNLQSPDLIAVEEIQDNSGPTDNGVVNADQTFAALIGAIQAAGGPLYDFRQLDPVNNADGGQPGGNIRVGFLFRTDRGLTFVDRPGATATTAAGVVPGAGGAELTFSPGRIEPEAAAFNDSRKPLVGEFTFRGETLFVVANHFNSKGGDNPLFGAAQPPLLASEVQRLQQAQLVNDFVDSILAIEPDAHVIVLGDLNDFQFSPVLDVVKDGVLVNLIDSLPLSEQYTYVFDGNSQVLDHTLVSNPLALRPYLYDIVHVNAEFPVDARASDHDPQVAFLCFDTTPPTLSVSASPNVLWPPNHKYVTVNITANVADDDDPQPVVELISATSSESDDGLGDGDTENDIQSVDGFTINLRAERGDKKAGRTYTLTYRATDGCGNSVDAQATVIVPANQGKVKSEVVTGSGVPDTAGQLYRQFLPQVEQ